MKKFLISMAIVSMAFIGCNNDDNNSTAEDCFSCSQANIELKWCYNPETQKINFYSEGTLLTSQSADADTWEQLKPSFQATCD